VAWRAGLYILLAALQRVQLWQMIELNSHQYIKCVMCWHPVCIIHHSKESQGGLGEEQWTGGVVGWFHLPTKEVSFITSGFSVGK
jgi:hypothetical protein